MRFTLKNIGKINNAEIELQGITVIAGENNTGKSTIGKMLFSVYDSFYRIKEQINVERRENISRLISGFYYEQMDWNARNFSWGSFAQYCVDQREYLTQDVNFVVQELKGFFQQEDKSFISSFSEEAIERVARRIFDSLQIEDDAIREVVLKKRLRAEFGMKIGHLNRPEERAEVCLYIRDSRIEFTVNGNTDVQIANYINLIKEICYIDDPFILDELNSDWRFFVGFSDGYDHRNNLLKKLSKKKMENTFSAIDELMAEKKLKNIFDSMDSVCDGKLLSSEDRKMYVYKSDHLDGELAISSLSTGIKSFVILRTLLENGSIDENSIIVMDEPEIHLHPEWQLRFAKIIVLIQKEFHANILLNTHSPYFLNAIEVFSKKYGVADRCRYYMTEEENGQVNIQDVTHHTESIYEKLARPLQVLEDLEYQDGDTVG